METVWEWSGERTSRFRGELRTKLWLDEIDTIWLWRGRLMPADMQSLGVCGSDSSGRTAGFGGRSSGACCVASAMTFSRLGTWGGNSDSDGGLRLCAGLSVVNAAVMPSMFRASYAAGWPSRYASCAISSTPFLKSQYSNRLRNSPLSLGLHCSRGHDTIDSPWYRTITERKTSLTAACRRRFRIMFVYLQCGYRPSDTRCSAKPS